MSSREKLGLIGEKIVAHYFGGILSENKFDEEKDMTLPDGSYAEVKTQIRWNLEHSFTVSSTVTENNIKKCVNVDRLFFVEPGRNKVIRIYECTDRKYKVKYPRNKKTYLFDINKMTLVHSFTNEKIWNEMTKLVQTPLKYLV